MFSILAWLFGKLLWLRDLFCSWRFLSDYLSGLIQAATSINEMTLSFVPKLFIVLLAMSLMATFTITQMTDYFSYIFDEISRKGL